LPTTPDYGKSVTWKDGVVLAPDAESLITRALRVHNGDAWQKVENGSMVFFIFGFVIP